MHNSDYIGDFITSSKPLIASLILGIFGISIQDYKEWLGIIFLAVSILATSALTVLYIAKYKTERLKQKKLNKEEFKDEIPGEI